MEDDEIRNLISNQTSNLECDCLCESCNSESDSFPCIECSVKNCIRCDFCIDYNKKTFFEDI